MLHLQYSCTEYTLSTCRKLFLNKLQRNVNKSQPVNIQSFHHKNDQNKQIAVK